MSLQMDTKSYLKGLSALATRGFASIQIAVDAILQLMTEQLGMRSSFLAVITVEKQLEVVAVYSLPGGCDIQEGTVVPFSLPLSYMSYAMKDATLFIVEQLRRKTDQSVRQTTQMLSHVGSYIGVPIILTDGRLFGLLGAVDPGPQPVKTQQAEMLVVLARRLADEIEREYEQNERKRAQLERDEALAALNEANIQLQMSKLKSDFIATISHEFRTSLTGIQGFSELMCWGNFGTEELKQFAADIHTDALRLSRLISNVLDIERIEAGWTALHLEPIDLNALIRDVIEPMHLTVPHHIFRLELDGSLPAVRCDHDKFLQLLTNLVQNAIKYSPAGGDIIIRTIREEESVHIQVQDHGIGIPQEHLERIFDRYTRIESHTSRYIQGTGLGLSIVRQIAQLHGGRAWAESNPGQGSLFHVTFPIAMEAQYG